MKKFLYSILTIIIILIGISFFVGYKMVCIATVPEYNYGHDYDTTYAMVYNKYPEMKSWHDSLVENGLWRDTFLVNEDGLRLHAVILEHSKSDSIQPTGAMMMIHGYCDNAPVMMRYAYCDYEILGQNVLLPERQWCGQSEGDHITFGWLDRLDMHLWLDMMHEMWNMPIVVHGLSMGAATTMMLSGDELDESLQVCGFVEDCGYSSTWDQMAYRLKVEYDLPEFPILHCASLINRIWHGWWLSDGNCIEQVSKCEMPMFFIHGMDDDYVPFGMGQSCYAAKKGEKEIWLPAKTAHAKSIHNFWGEYCDRVGCFVNNCHLLLNQ